MGGFLEVLLGPLGSVLGTSGAVLGVYRGLAGDLGGYLWGKGSKLLGFHSGAPLGGLLGASWAPLGGLLGRLVAFLGCLGALFDRLGTIWGLLGPWPSRNPLGPSWSV